MCGISTSTSNTYELFRLSSSQTKVNRYVYLLNQKVSLSSFNFFQYMIKTRLLCIGISKNHLKYIDFHNFLFISRAFVGIRFAQYYVAEIYFIRIQHDTFGEEAFRIVIQAFEFEYETSVACMYVIFWVSVLFYRNKDKVECSYHVFIIIICMHCCWYFHFA